MRLLIQFGIPPVCPPDMKGLAWVPTSLFYLPFLFLDARSVSRPSKIEPVIEERVAQSDAHIVKLDAQEIRIIGAINREKEKFDGLKVQPADLGQDEMTDARLALHPQMECETQDRIHRAEGGRKISF